MSRSENLLAIVQDSIFKSDVPAKEVAKGVGKLYPTLMREVNPYDKGAKLGADTLIQIMQITKDIAPLEYMAKEVGYRVVPE